jgi:hypothetical protein
LGKMRTYLESMKSNEVSSRIGWFNLSKNRSFFAFFQSCSLATLSPLTILSIGLKLAYLHSEACLECK